MPVMNGKAAGFWRRFVPLLAIGFFGVVVVGFDAVRVVDRLFIDAPPPRPPWMSLIAASLVQPTLALFLSAAVGALLAHRFGLVSAIAHGSGWDKFRSSLLLYFGTGILTGGALIAADRLVFNALIPEFFANARKLSHAPADTLLIGVFFGGVTEEIVMRWGLMSLLVFMLNWLRRWLAFGRIVVERPSPLIYWSSICLAALVFAAAHLPSAAAIGPPTQAVIARVLLLNAVAGVLFGWLFWRYTLESAMVAHAALHVVFFAAAIGGNT
jgi:hypothetical protein